MRHAKNRAAVVVSLAVSACISGSAITALGIPTTDTWTGGGADNNFLTALNWNASTGNAPPVPGDILAFDGSRRFTRNFERMR